MRFSHARYVGSESSYHPLIFVLTCSELLHHWSPVRYTKPEHKAKPGVPVALTPTVYTVPNSVRGGMSTLRRMAAPVLCPRHPETTRRPDRQSSPAVTVKRWNRHQMIPLVRVEVTTPSRSRTAKNAAPKLPKNRRAPTLFVSGGLSSWKGIVASRA